MMFLVCRFRQVWFFMARGLYVKEWTRSDGKHLSLSSIFKINPLEAVGIKKISLEGIFFGIFCIFIKAR